MSTKKHRPVGSLIDPASGTEMDQVIIRKFPSMYHPILELLISVKYSDQFLTWFGKLISEDKKPLIQFKCVRQPERPGSATTIEPIDNFFYITKFNARNTSKSRWTVRLQLFPARDNFAVMKAYNKGHRRDK